MGAVADQIFLEHFERVKAAVLSGHTLASIPKWMVDNTTLRGRQFSFKNHEYQEAILLDQSREKVIRKCSQIGISELAARVALALANIIDGCTVIYTLPTAAFAKTFAKTRLDPVIAGSKALKSAVNVTADNTEMKQFGQSFIYIKGTVGTGAAISIPADVIINDEVDFSDAEVMSNYQSRLTHSEHKIKWKFSTPTVEGFGISAEFSSSRRHYNFVKCNHCNHHFLPSYFEHVRIPGFKGDSLREINKDNVHLFNHKLAFVECPKCKAAPSLQPEHREWVVENPEANYEAAGYQIQPFDAPNIISCSDLILASTKYKRYVDFENFSLGLPAEDTETTLTRSDLENCFVTGESSFWTHVMGVDMGMVCHLMIAGVDHLGQIMVVHTEKIPAARLRARREELKRKYNVKIEVMDSQPYTETVIALQADDPNLYGAVYTNSKDLSPFHVKKQDEDKEVADLQLRQVNINRNKAFDGLMVAVRSGKWAMVADSNKENIIEHFQDMKRVKEYTQDGEITYVWRKSPSGNDHFHHTALYTWVAAQLMGVSDNRIILPGMMFKFKHKS